MSIPQIARSAALQYYYTHREDRLKYAEQYRRATTVEKREKARSASLRHYYAHREEKLKYAEQYRRAHRIHPRHTMSGEERENRIVMCGSCGEQVRTPSLVKRGRRLCARCGRRRYLTNTPEKRYLRAHKCKASVKAKYRALTATLSCAKCGATESLDFHHRDPALKIMKVSRIVGRSLSWVAVQREIEKCDVLCKACHREAHVAYSSFVSSRSKTTS